MHFILGLIIGSVMGLTGAGGALVAIPLFMHFLTMDLKQASVYSLFAVIIASFMNLLNQKKDVQIKISLLIVTFSILGSFLAVPLKTHLDEFIIALLLVAVSLFALVNIWNKKNIKIENAKINNRLVTSVLSGLLLGVLTTLTGLGGGVVMVPLLMRFYQFNQRQAIASSLFAVAISSVFSLGIQALHGISISVNQNFLILVAGIIFSAIMLKFAVKLIPDSKTQLIQKLIFTLVVLFAWYKILI
jgi:uncharacterized membrane protein YfcA